MLTMITFCGTANAMSGIKSAYYNATHSTNEYSRGYHNGKQHAYNNVAKTVFFVGFATVAAVMIYQAGKESSWGTNENGVVYRF